MAAAEVPEPIIHGPRERDPATALWKVAAVPHGILLSITDIGAVQSQEVYGNAGVAPQHPKIRW